MLTIQLMVFRIKMCFLSFTPIRSSFKNTIVKGKNKGKAHPRTNHEGPEGGVEVQLYSFLNLGARWGWVVSTTPRPVYTQERPGTHCTEGWLGFKAVLDGCGKSRSHRDMIPVPPSP